MRAAGSAYYVGKPCKRGHEGVRYTRNCECVECHRLLLGQRDRTLRDPTDTYKGRPCKRGHDGTRYTANGVCVACKESHNAARSDSVHLKSRFRPGQVRSVFEWDGVMR